MVDIWIKLSARIGGNKLERNILLPENLSDPGKILDLFSDFEKLCKKLKDTK